MTPVRVQIRGFTIELDGADPRAAQIEALLLGPPQPPEPETPPEPPLTPPELAFWDAIDRYDRRLLLMLVDGPRPASEIDKALVPYETLLRIRLRRITVTATELGLPACVHKRGRTRSVRVYRLDERWGSVVRRLARTPAPV